MGKQWCTSVSRSETREGDARMPPNTEACLGLAAFVRERRGEG